MIEAALHSGAKGLLFPSLANPDTFSGISYAQRQPGELTAHGEGRATIKLDPRVAKLPLPNALRHHSSVSDHGKKGTNQAKRGGDA